MVLGDGRFYKTVDLVLKKITIDLDQNRYLGQGQVFTYHRNFGM